MASFQAKMAWKSLRKRENKNYHSVSVLPDTEQKISKKQQKNSKYIKKHHCGYISSQNRLEKDEKE